MIILSKRGSVKVFYQQGGNLNNPDQNSEFIFGENENYQQIGNSYLQYDITVRKSDSTCFNDAPIKVVKNALAFTFKEARLSSTGGSDLEDNKFVGQISTLMRFIASKDQGLIYCFD